MKEFTRGREFYNVVFSDGTKSKVSHELKNNIGQMYWYYIQFPCGGWRNFGIRSLLPESEIPRDCILTPKSLPFLSELLSKMTWKEFHIICFETFKKGTPI